MLHRRLIALLLACAWSPAALAQPSDPPSAPAEATAPSQPEATPKPAAEAAGEKAPDPAAPPAEGTTPPPGPAPQNAPALEKAPASVPLPGGAPSPLGTAPASAPALGPPPGLTPARMTAAAEPAPAEPSVGVSTSVPRPGTAPYTLAPITVVGRRPGAAVRAASTASKTDTPLIDLPAAVVVVPREVLVQQNVQNMNDAVRNASGVIPVMGGSYGFADRYLMRGLSQRFLRDGLPDGPSFNGYLRTMTDVERIEILKGPGSALYGRTEPGGVINVVTKRPAFTSDWVAEGGAGSFGTSKLLLSGGSPLTAGLGTRLDAGYQQTEGYRGVGRTVWEVMPSVELRPAADHRLTLDYDLRRMEVVPDNYGILYAPIDPAAPIPNRRPLPVDPETRYYSPFNNVRQVLHRLTLRHEWRQSPALEVRTAFAFDRRLLDLMRNAGGAVSVAGPILRSTARTARAQEDRAYHLVLQQEAVGRVTTGPLAHTVLLGFEAEKFQIRSDRDDIPLPNIEDVLAPAVPEVLPGDFAPVPSFRRKVRLDAVGVYLQEQLALWSFLKLRAGGRYDRVAHSDAGQARANANAPLASRRVAASQGLFTGQAGLVLQPLPQLSVYSGLSSGKFVNVQTESSTLTTKPEGSSQVELGVKTALLDDRVQGNLAAFRTTRSNFYVTPFGGGDSQPVGEQETKGLELDLLAVATRGLTLTANLALYRPRITSDQLQMLGSTRVNIRDRKPQGVPERIGQLWASYEQPSGLLRGLGLGAGLRYQGESFADALNYNRVPPYWLMDASAFYRRPRFEVQVNLQNLTDTDYFAYATFSGAAPGTPRALYGTVRYRY